MIPIATGVHWDMRRYMQLVVALSEGEWVTKETKRFRLRLIFCLTFSLAALRPLVASGSCWKLRPAGPRPMDAKPILVRV
jgi:hypothetical protein